MARYESVLSRGGYSYPQTVRPVAGLVAPAPDVDDEPIATILIGRRCEMSWRRRSGACSSPAASGGALQTGAFCALAMGADNISASANVDAAPAADQD